MSDLPIIASLWIGGNLSYIEQLCLKSFADHGHRTLLYTYEPVDNAPPGVETLDANAIFPASDFIRHAESGSPAVHADAFRYKMIALQNVIWVDADMLCMQPWAFKDQWVFGWEKTDRLVCNAALGLPRFSRTLGLLNDFCKDEYPIPPWADDEERAQLEAAAAAGQPVHVSELKWGVWGPSALTYFLEQTGEIAHILPQEAFYPISFKDRRMLLAPQRRVNGQLGKGCYGVHLWNRRLSRRLVTNHDGLPPEGSFIAQALLRHQIDPLRAPIPDRPPKGYPTQSELAQAALEGREIPLPAAAPSVAAAPPLPPAMREIWRGKPLDRLIQSPHYQAAIDNLELRTNDLADRLPPPDAPMSHDHILILTSMKNEAPFILEWIAYNLAIGVTHFLVYTNDCTDNTTAILDRLAELGHVTRRDNPWDPASDKKPQHVALQDALDQPAYQRADWVLTIDIDEFVNIHVGDGTFADFFDAAGDPNVVSFTWKFFGNDGVDIYEDKPIMAQFTACAPEFIPKPRLGWGFKSMVHKSAPYTKIGVHRPLDLNDEANLPAVRWVNGSGRAMPEALLTNNGWRSTKRSLGYRLATLNHYILRSADSFLVKRDRGRINHTDQDQGIDYWMRRNYTTETDARMQHRLPMMQRQLDRLMADPQLAQLHRDAVAWHKHKIAELKADPDYAALYDAVTQVVRPDAIYITKPEGEDTAANDILIPEPEQMTLSPEEVAAKTAMLRDMLHGNLRRDDAPGPEPRAATAPAIVPIAASDIWLPQAPASALTEPRDPRFLEARNHASKNAGFFWEGPENALYFEPFGKRLVVTFDNLSIVNGEGPRWPWGYDFLTKTMGCSVLGVMANKRNWFRESFVHDSFDLLRDGGFFRQFDEVLFYGASMGGFAALTYVRCAPGARVLAIAPQSTLDRRIMPDEDRWGWTARLNWDDRYGDAAGHTGDAAEVITLHDPYFAPDQAQVARLSGGNLRHLRMPFFGHQLPNALVNMKILKPMLIDMFAGDLSDERFYTLLRARRDLPRYQHDLLMKAEEKNRVNLAIKVCEYTLKKRDASNIARSLRRLRAALAAQDDA
ncbi:MULTISPECIES: glycosyltransferase family 2 protein [unclassified Yoonia]|uniref:glycosyltransferase family 2 protein n=1 Tax=unclassified Yoonia TaxID=2629118 RepID=UPI002AFF9DC9|nr:MULTISPECIES: glycosyltransferase family 2 protein [unclassified Yoonia]